MDWTFANTVAAALPAPWASLPDQPLLALLSNPSENKLLQLSHSPSRGDGRAPIPPKLARSIRSLEPLLTVRKSLPSSHWSFGKLDQAPRGPSPVSNRADKQPAVKFDTEELPSILNALETDNNGNRLVLEVAVWKYTAKYAQVWC